MKFVKLHGQGNDFLVTLAEALGRESHDMAARARAICDRHTGVGADGLILVRECHDAIADFEVRIFNADGSEAEVSGNGVRCVAAYLHYAQLSTRPRLAIRTAVGTMILRLLESRGRAYRFESDMGAPIMAPQEIPFTGEGCNDRVVHYPLPIGNERLWITATSMGNPHCAVFCDDLDEAFINRVGPILERHTAFPRRTNVEFIKTLNRQAIAVRFWERGVGRTLSSGTGSSSAVVAAVLNGLTDTQVTVQTLAGPLEVEWREREHVFLTGPAEVVCQGEYLVEDAP
ncbi:MAG: diaminopimelate epimerase [Acidobacteria bacterium]|nr:diaminopimelate epimerase [Acidobacteriota bacterium]MBI3657086.1 diaminopimelate epimerase [Acidobacteriota bacterium]